MKFEDSKLIAEINEPASREFTEMERKLISVILGLNTAIVQFVVEGILKPEDQPHFVMHLNDAVARLYNKEVVLVYNNPVELAVDTAAGDVALKAFEDAVARGKIVHNDPQSQTDSLGREINANWGAPVDTKRTLN